jgi:hypothetical protein
LSLDALDVKEIQGRHADDGEKGPLIRIAPNYVAVGNPYELRKVWGVRSPFERSDWYHNFRLDPPDDSLITIVDNDTHAALRNKLLPGVRICPFSFYFSLDSAVLGLCLLSHFYGQYAGRDFEGLQEGMDKNIAHFIRLLEEKYLSTNDDLRPVDLAAKIRFFANDNISRVAFSQEFGFMDADDDLWGYIHQVHTSLRAGQVFSLVPWFRKVVQSPLFKGLLPSHTDPSGVGAMLGFVMLLFFVGYRFLD